MFFRRRRNTIENEIPSITSQKKTTTTMLAVTPEQALRRQMYERMARRSGVLDAEETAQRDWSGH